MAVLFEISPSPIGMAITWYDTRMMLRAMKCLIMVMLSVWLTQVIITEYSLELQWPLFKDEAFSLCFSRQSVRPAPMMMPVLVAPLVAGGGHVTWWMLSPATTTMANRDGMMLFPVQCPLTGAETCSYRSERNSTVCLRATVITNWQLLNGIFPF